MAVSPAPPSPAQRSPDPPPVLEVRIGRTLGILLTILAGAAVAYLAWQVIALFSHVLLIIMLALLVAFVAAPAVGAIEKQTGLPRLAAIALTYAGSLFVLGAVLVIFLGPLITQIGDLIQKLPAEMGLLQDRLNGIDQIFIRYHLPFRVASVQKQVLDQAQAIGTTLLGSTLIVLGSLTSFIVDFFLVVVLSFYLLLDSATIHNNLVRLLPPEHRSKMFFVEAAFVKVVGGYIRGQLLMALTIGVAAGLGCLILGVQFPLVIGLLAGLFELMPMVGPVLGAVPAVLISVTTQGFPLVLWVILLFVVIQQVESNVIGPRITGHAVGLHPLGALLALLAGVELGGIVGALFAVPATGVLYVLAVAVYWQWQGRAIPAAPRQQSRVVGLARGLARRRGSVATPSPVEEARSDGATITAAATAATAGGDLTPRPETLIDLDREATHLRERFERAESERIAHEARAESERKAHETRAGAASAGGRGRGEDSGGPHPLP